MNKRQKECLSYLKLWGRRVASVMPERVSLPQREKSKTAFVTRAWATEGTKPCLECHIEKKQFALNFYGWQVLNAMKGLKGM